MSKYDYRKAVWVKWLVTAPNVRIGYGEDAHKLVIDRSLVIGGVSISESPRGCEAHSDGDVLLHALSDALLAAFALGDIGSYFPPSNPDFKDMNSHLILRKVLELLSPYNAKIINLALVVTLDTPKLGSYRKDIQEQLAELLNLEKENIGIGFKTSEGLAPDHIQARVTVLLSTNT